jgi:ABC-type antimicrobial peptide transport system permease subunit
MESEEKGNATEFRIDKTWWVKQVLLIVLGGFYLYFGVHLLIASYKLNNPFSFLLTFFASNFIILISAALLIGFIYRLVVAYRYIKKMKLG